MHLTLILQPVNTAAHSRTSLRECREACEDVCHSGTGGLLSGGAVEGDGDEIGHTRAQCARRRVRHADGQVTVR